MDLTVRVNSALIAALSQTVAGVTYPTTRMLGNDIIAAARLVQRMTSSFDDVPMSVFTHAYEVVTDTKLSDDDKKASDVQFAAIFRSIRPVTAGGR